MAPYSSIEPLEASPERAEAIPLGQVASGGGAADASHRGGDRDKKHE